MNKLILVLILQLSVASCTNNISDNNSRENIVKNPPKNTSSKIINNQLENKLAQTLVVNSILDGGSKESNYDKAISMIQNNEREEGLVILQSLVDSFPDYVPAKSMLDRLESPFALAASKVEDYIDKWIARPSQVPVFSVAQPVMPAIPPNPVLKKGEFETTAEFNLRVLRANEEYQKQVDLITNNYLTEVEAYNEAVGEHNSNIEWEKKSRIEKVPTMRKRFLDIAFEEALGNPVVKNLEYDADNEVFYGQIESEYKNLVLNVEIPVVLSEAKAFKEGVDDINPAIKIDMIDGNIIFSDVSLNYNGKSYNAQLLESEKILAPLPQVTIGDNGINIQKVSTDEIQKLKVNQVIQDNRQFFIPKI